jgi:stage V sporulation protein R
MSLATAATRIATPDELWRLRAYLGRRMGDGPAPFPMHYEIVPSSILYEFGAYGLPGRFSHWTHGKAYHQMKTMYDYGLSKIYELVINTNPCYAFLLDTNGFVQNKMIIAHVLAHSDYFANNAYYAHIAADARIRLGQCEPPAPV